MDGLRLLASTPPRDTAPVVPLKAGDRIPGDFTGIAIRYHAAVPADTAYWFNSLAPGRSYLLFRDTHALVRFRFYAGMKPVFAAIDKELADRRGTVGRKLDRLLDDTLFLLRDAAEDLIIVLDDIKEERWIADGRYQPPEEEDDRW